MRSISEKMWDAWESEKERPETAKAMKRAEKTPSEQTAQRAERTLGHGIPRQRNQHVGRRDWKTGCAAASHGYYEVELVGTPSPDSRMSRIRKERPWTLPILE
jgi:hypothetical protein